MLVMTVRHIGKLPHSKLPQYGQTQWQQMSPERRLAEDFPGHRSVGLRQRSVAQCANCYWYCSVLVCLSPSSHMVQT